MDQQLNFSAATRGPHRHSDPLSDQELEQMAICFKPRFLRTSGLASASHERARTDEGWPKGKMEGCRRPSGHPAAHPSGGKQVLPSFGGEMPAGQRGGPARTSALGRTGGGPGERRSRAVVRADLTPASRRPLRRRGLFTVKDVHRGKQVLPSVGGETPEGQRGGPARTSALGRTGGGPGERRSRAVVRADLTPASRRLAQRPRRGGGRAS